MNMIYFHIFAGPFWWKMHVLTIFAFTVYGELHDLQKPRRLFCFCFFFPVKVTRSSDRKQFGSFFSQTHKENLCVQR